MKNRFIIILFVCLLMVLLFVLPSCGKSQEDTDDREIDTPQEEQNEIPPVEERMIFTRLNDGTYCLYHYNGEEEEYTVPEEYEGKPVTEIAGGAFYGCHNLRSVVIPDTVRKIGRSAFKNSQIRSITIGNGVETIGEEAFFGCSYLIDITIGNGLRYVGTGAFEASGIKYAVAYLFAHPEEVKEELLADGAYLGNEQNPYVLFLRILDKNATTCTIKEGTRVIYDYAFAECQLLTSVTIPEGVTGMGSDLFQYSPNITTLSIPNSIESIGMTPFPESVNHTEYKGGQYLGNDNNPYVVLVKVLDETVKTFEINDSTRAIVFNVFDHCDMLKTITIPDSVAGLWDNTFSNCRALTSVVLGMGVKQMGECVFSPYQTLKKVYYRGTAQDREEIEVMDMDTAYMNIDIATGDAVWYYYSETEPTEVGHYWRFDSDGAIITEWE